MEQSITGSIRISEYDYPFSFEKETEKITVYIGQEPLPFQMIWISSLDKNME